MAKKPDAKTTRMQELGSAWILRRAIKDNKRYSKWQDILEDEKYSELKKLYPDVDEEWIQGYYAQQERILKKYANSQFTEFNRDGGFMDFITKLVKEKFGISKKDNWNPADIWLVKNEQQVIRLIEKTVDGNGSQTIMELNAVMKKLFKEEKLVGVSLKKISGKQARWEEVNVSDVSLTNTYNFDTTKMKIDLRKKGKSFATQDARIFVNGHGVEYNFQIKGNTTTKFANIKFEPTARGASGARIGKSPLKMVEALMNDNKLHYNNSHKSFPKTLEEYLKEEKTYISLFERLHRNKVEMGVNKKQFIENMRFVYENTPYMANSKLIQMYFLDQILSLKKPVLDEFMTDMVFLSAKKGKRFGPFGKLY
jgi:hypothetical protein